jgi:hypothetical protein
VLATSAKLHAEIDPGGAAAGYHFDYLTAAAYQANLDAGHEAFAGAQKLPLGSDPLIAASGGVQSVAQTLGGLSPETSYRYRAVVHGAGGSDTGPALSFTTGGFGGTSPLLDGRGWEMVSPLDKNGGQIQGFGQISGGGVLQAAAGGGAVTYSSSASFAGGSGGAPVASQYISRRGASGWLTESITAPALSGSYGDEPNGVPYRLFSPDLARGLMLNGVHCRTDGSGCPIANPPLPGSGAPAGFQNYYLRDSGSGGFEALLDGSELGGASPGTFSVAFVGASPDLAHIVLSSCTKLSTDASEVPDPPGCNPAATNLYEWSGGGLELLNLLPGETQGTPGAKLAAPAGAVSNDGQRVYFTDGEDSPLYLREAGGPTKLVPESEGGAESFQTASADGRIAYFTRGGGLYRYDAIAQSSQQIAGGVEGVLGASEDGARVYYETAAGLFLWQAGSTAAVASQADPGNWPPATGSARLSPDGTRLLFASAAPLTGYDNADQSSGLPDAELFLYDAGTTSLTCVSCNPTGERPLGPSSVPGASANGAGPGAIQAYKPRVLIAGGARVFFDSGDALAQADTNQRPDAYEWEAAGVGGCQKAAGCLGLISSGRSLEGASFVDASADGHDAFFLTDGSLVGGDGGAVDVYDAREGGGFPAAAEPIACEGDSCQNLPPEPEDPQPGTLVPGSGNPALHFAKAHHQHKKDKKKKKKQRQGHRNARGGRR